LFATLFKQITNDDSAIGGRAFLITGDEEADRAIMIGMRRDKFFGCHDECGNRGFHVCRTTAE